MNKLLFFAALITLAAAPVRADDMNCGSDLIQPGDSVESLFEKCGQPDSTIETDAKYLIYKKDNTYQVSTSQGTVSEIKTLYE